MLCFRYHKLAQQLNEVFKRRHVGAKSFINHLESFSSQPACSSCLHQHTPNLTSTHSSVLAWRIPGTGEAGGLPSMGSHRVGHNWSDLAATWLQTDVTGSQTGKNNQTRPLSSSNTTAPPPPPASSFFTINTEQAFHVYRQKYLWQCLFILGVLKL